VEVPCSNESERYREQPESPRGKDWNRHREQPESPRTLVPPRLAARFAHCVRCSACVAGAATSARPLSFPPVTAGWTVCAGGN